MCYYLLYLFFRFLGRIITFLANVPLYFVIGYSKGFAVTVTSETLVLSNKPFSCLIFLLYFRLFRSVDTCVVLPEMIYGGKVLCFISKCFVLGFLFLLAKFSCVIRNWALLISNIDNQVHMFV